MTSQANLVACPPELAQPNPSPTKAKKKPAVSKASKNFEQAAPVCCTCKFFNTQQNATHHRCTKNGFAVWKVSLCDDWRDKITNVGLE